MDVVSIFALIILILSIITLLVGVAAYLAFKIRQSRGRSVKVHGGSDADSEAIFLKRYRPGGSTDNTHMG